MLHLLHYSLAADADPARLGELFPAHAAAWGRYRDEGTLLAIGPMENTADGALGIFTTREAAEAFATGDPFVVEGLVGQWRVVAWREAIWHPAP